MTHPSLQAPIPRKRSVRPTAADHGADLLRLSLLSLGLATAFAAQAQTADVTKTTKEAGKDTELETVTVTGLRASARKALQRQFQANHIVSAVSADDIGGLPDKNAAEAVSRTPGASLQRDQGEGRYVTVRGIAADLNSVTINDAVIPSAEASRRGVALDVLPAGMIRSLDVSKTLMPDQDANSIGATVAVRTLSAFDLKDRLLTVGLGASQDSLSSKVSPTGNLLWADRFLDGKLGVALGLSAEKREFRSDDVETGGAWTGNKLTGFEQRAYQPTRERQAFALNVDYRPDTETSYYVRSLVSSFSDNEVRDRLTIGSFSAAGGSIAEGETTTARAERRLRQRKYTQTVNSLSVGTDQQWEDWKAQVQASRSVSSEDTPESINDARFRQSNVAGVSFTSGVAPLLSGPASLYDPTRYTLNSFTLQARQSRDSIDQLKLDLSRPFTLADLTGNLKVGAKLMRRVKTNDTDQWAYTTGTATSPSYWGAGPTTLAGFVSGQEADYTLGRIGVAFDPSLVRDRLSTLPRDAARLARESAINDYRMREDIDAAYAQASVNPLDHWMVLAGVRAEHTSFRANGSQVATNNSIQSIERQRSYTNLLPGLHTRYDLDSETSIRGALTRSVVRANFSQLAPGVNLLSATEAVIGNPDLKPLTSNNVDIGIERMLGRDGAVSAYAFHKQIQNYTYTTNIAGTGSWLNYTTATSYANGSRAAVSGLELSYQHALRMLPGAWNGLIVGANATFSQSSAQVGRIDPATGAALTRDITLPGQSRQVFNLMLGYETGPFSGRLAWQRQSRYLLEMGSNILDGTQDRFVDAQQFLDASVAYQLTPKIQVVAEAANLTRQKYYVYQGDASRNVQNEQYGRTYKIGLKASVF